HPVDERRDRRPFRRSVDGGGDRLGGAVPGENGRGEEGRAERAEQSSWHPATLPRPRARVNAALAATAPSIDVVRDTIDHARWRPHAHIRAALRSASLPCP